MGERDEVATVPLQAVGRWRLTLYFLRLGGIGFGGPIALAGAMQRDLVPRRWITEEEYVEGLAFSQMMPGPLAAQLAMWIGYIRHGVAGASLAGLAFVLPTYFIVLAIAALYVAYNGLALVQALFSGIGPVVIAIVARSAVKLARTTIGSERPLWGIFAAVGTITVVARAEIALLFVLAGVIGILIYARQGGENIPRTPALLALPLAAAASSQAPVLLALAAFFVKAGAFTFGSGLAIVPFLHQGVVQGHHWLTERQFLDAVAVGIITPGPVVITAAFVGYLVAGFWGSVVAAAGVFLPVYFFVLFVGRYIIRYRNHRGLKGFVKGATAGAAGAIAGASLILAQGTVSTVPAGIIAGASLILLWRTKIPEPILVLCGAVAGIALYGR